MSAKHLLVAGLAATGAAGAVSKCGTEAPSKEHEAETTALMQKYRDTLSPSNEFRLNDPVVVPTVVHVVASDESVEGGYIGEALVQDQIDVLNDAYGPHDITFSLDDIHYYVDPFWAETDEFTYNFPETREGGYDTLNLYIKPSLGSGFAGICTFPQADIEDESETMLRDGCIIVLSTLPGSGEQGQDQGKTAVHEVGHWMNLRHTFEGEGCSEPGDFVDDTPTQLSPSSGCPVGRNSCPDLPGVDPIHNFMDYSSDDCLEEFTDGQKERMMAAWHEWRASS